MDGHKKFQGEHGLTGVGRSEQAVRLLINYTNERLQLLFCHQVLVKEQASFLADRLTAVCSRLQEHGNQHLNGLRLAIS